MISFSTKCKHYIPHILIILLFISLWAAIYFRIDGLGIFSITCAIVIFTLAIYKENKKPIDGGGGPGTSNVVDNMSSINEFITNYKFWELVLPLITVLLTILSKKLDAEKLQKNHIKINNSLPSEHDDGNFDPKPFTPRKRTPE
jgi:hypothetical protein